MSLPGRLVETNQGRVFVHRSGRGAPLVMVHGLMMSHYYFRDLLPVLAADREVITIDLPGFGESDRPSPRQFAYDLPAFASVVDQVLSQLGIERATLLGHSMGGGTVLTLAARRPERVERLILIASTIYRLPIRWEARVVLTSLVGPFLWQRAVRPDLMRMTMRREHVRDPAAITDEFVRYCCERARRAGGREAAYAALAALSRLGDSSPEPERVRCPTLLLWGEEDRAVPLAHGKRLARTIAQSRLAVVPASGHLPFLERPAEFLRQLVPFLKETP